MSAPASSSQHIDFQILGETARELLSKGLKVDEGHQPPLCFANAKMITDEKNEMGDSRMFTDLIDQFDTDSKGLKYDHDYDHKYYAVSSPSSSLLPLTHLRNVEIPHDLKQILDGKKTSIVHRGLLPEISHAWLSIDNLLYLWSYESTPSAISPRYVSYTKAAADAAGEIKNAIMSLALVTPKANTFSSRVEYVLAVSTQVEVHLLAITRSPDGTGIVILPTKYHIVTDGVHMIKMVGSRSGRIFMAGDDGNLHELRYENDSQKIVPWGNDFKCQKYYYTNWSYITPPSFLLSIFNWDDSLVDVCVDDARGVVYALSEKGLLYAYYIGGVFNSDRDSSDPNIFRLLFYSKDRCEKFATINIKENAISWVKNKNKWVNRGIPTNLSSATPEQTKIVGLHIIPPTESDSVHLVAVMSSGIRVYMGLLGLEAKPVDKPFSPSFEDQITGSKPLGINIHFVRSPPPSDALSDASTISTTNPKPKDHKFDINKALVCEKTFYKNGVFLSYIPGAGAGDGGKVLGICEDLTQRNESKLKDSKTDLHVQPKQRFRETVQYLRVGQRFYDGESVVAIDECINIYNEDIEESRLARLFHASLSPSNLNDTTEKRNGTSSFSKTSSSSKDDGIVLPSSALSDPTTAAGSRKRNRDDGEFTSIVSTVESVIHNGGVIYQTRPGDAGFNKDDFKVICQMSELASQSMITIRSSTAREFAVLTKDDGIRIYRKTRPIDYLFHEILSQVTNDKTYKDLAIKFAYQYGAAETCAMCMSIACGLPKDLDVTPQTKSKSMDALRHIHKHFLKERVNFYLNPNNPQQPIAKTDNCGFDTRSFYIVVARILRPIWFRKPILCTPTTSKSRHLKFIIAKNELQAIKYPLMNFLENIEFFYDKAVQMKVTTLNPVMNLNPTFYPRGFDTAQRASYNNQVEARKNRPGDDENIENAFINKLYRLVYRSVQLISLLQLLIDCKTKHGLSVEFNYIEGKTFVDLVISDVQHSSIGKILNQLLFGSKPLDSSLSDMIVAYLQKYCFMYFSPGAEYFKDAQTSLKKAKKMSISSRNKDLGDAISKAIQAAKYWTSLNNVSGKQSDLSLFADQLKNVGGIARELIVELVMATSINFLELPYAKVIEIGLGKRAPGQNISISGLNGLAKSQMDRYRSLYHGGSINNAPDKTALKECYDVLFEELREILKEHKQQSNASLTSANTFSAGATLGNLSGILPDGKMDIFERMIQRAVALNPDYDYFHDLLNEFLFQNSKSTLMKLKSKFVDKFLRGKQSIATQIMQPGGVGVVVSGSGGSAIEVHLSFWSYMEKKLFEIAMREETTKAMCNNNANGIHIPIPIEQRQEHLNHAIRAGNELIKELGLINGGDPRLAQIDRDLRTLQQKNISAGIQMDLIRESKKLLVKLGPRKDLESFIKRCENFLLSIDEMLGSKIPLKKGAVFFNLFGISLQLYAHLNDRSPNHNLKKEIKRLWYSIISYECPRWVQPNKPPLPPLDRIEDLFKRIPQDEKPEEKQIREETLDDQAWQLGMISQIKTVASNILRFNVYNPVYLPLQDLLVILESISYISSDHLGIRYSPWVFQCFLDANVKSTNLFDAYMNAYNAIKLNNSSESKKLRYRLLCSWIAVTDQWMGMITAYKSHQKNPDDAQRLRALCLNGQISIFIDTWEDELIRHLTDPKNPHLDSKFVNDLLDSLRLKVSIIVEK